MRRLVSLCALVSLSVLATSSTRAMALPAVAAPTTRTVYVTVTDKDGRPVPGLTAADFTVKEGGKDVEIKSVAPPTARMKLALMLEESITADSSLRQGAFDFAKRMISQADVAIVLIGLRSRVIVEHTTDLAKIAGALSTLSLRQNPDGENLADGIYEQARSFQKNPPERPAIVVVGIETYQSSGEKPEQVLNELRKSGAVFYAVTVGRGYQEGNVGDLSDLAERGKAIGECTRYSGGARIEATSTSAIPRALGQVASELSAQYQITYMVPEGVKLSDRLQVTTKRKSVTFRAPSRIPN